MSYGRGTGLNFQMGWVDRPDEVDRVVSALPKPFFRTAAPAIAEDAMDGPEAKDGFWFWEQGEEQVLGNILPANDQGSVGSCVGQGYSRNVGDLMLIEIVHDLQEPEEFPDDLPKSIPFVSVESVYGASRVEVGGGRINGDGSVGAWAAKAVKEYGCLFRKPYGRYDLSRPDGNRDRQWGRSGIPDELEPYAREHIVSEVTKVLSGDDVFRSNLNGYPTPFCSNQGFTTVRQNGFCRPKGTWMHCMGSAGAGIVKGNKPCVGLRQSWGNSPTGPTRVVMESGREIDLPEGVFLVELDTIDRMARQGDTFSLAGFRGFRKRRPKWRV